jgi:hypothetical protein
MRLLVTLWSGRGLGDFRRRARLWFAHFCYSLLRAGRDFPAADAEEWPTSLRQQCAFSSCCGASRPRDGVHFGGNTRAIFWVPAWDASAGALAPALPTKTRGTAGEDEAAQADGDIAQARGGLSLRRPRRVRRKNPSSGCDDQEATTPHSNYSPKTNRNYSDFGQSQPNIPAVSNA